MQFQQESLTTTYGEILLLAESNNAETGAIKDLSIDIDTYKDLEAKKFLRLFTARDGETLVGYCLMLINKHPHYANTLCASQDTLYLSPEYRGIGGVKFIKWCDSQLESEGLDYVFRQVTRKNDFSRTLESMSYIPVETNYMRKLQSDFV